MVGHFLEACLAGDIDSLMGLLAEDVTAWMDGGGKVGVAARQMVRGRAQVARGIMGHRANVPEGMTIEVIEVNGLPALLGRVKGHIVNVVTLEVEGDYIRTLRTVANPDKLAHLNVLPMSGQARRVGA
jgi:RNA polymerase sigma-70 factor (ECF subfamily)